MSSVASEERVFSLLLALAATEHGLTKHDILSTVHGYAQRYADSAQRGNIERQFERDKESLRDLGIPLDTFEPHGEEGNNQQTRYRIPVEQLQLTHELDLSDREVGLLRLASYAWRESTLSGDARRATMKLASLGNPIDARLFGVAPTITTREPAFGPVNDALSDRIAVKFLYQKATEEQATLRHVAPLALEQIDGRWHLITFDFERGDDRVFLLSRIAGPIHNTGQKYDLRLLERVGHVLAELVSLRERQVATVFRSPDTEAFVRLQEQIHYLDEDVLAEELVAFGPDVVVLSPDSLREKVVRLLSRVLQAHEPPVGGDA